MTNEEIRQIAGEAAHEAVDRLFLRLGIDPADADEISAFKKDLRHIRVWREATGVVKVAVIRAALTVLVTGALGALWMIIKGNQ